MRLALIDDREEERRQTMELFSSFAEKNNFTFTVDAFESGEAFLSAFSPYTYDIVFMDIYMDGMTGVEARAQNAHGRQPLSFDLSDQQRRTYGRCVFRSRL